MMFSKSEALEDAIKRLADIRQQSENEVADHFSREELEKTPKVFSQHIKSMYELPIVASGVEDGMPYVRLKNGRIFYGHLPAKSHLNQYYYVKDRLPAAIVGDAFLIALDVAVRYVRMWPWPPPEVRPPRDGLIVECGAYLGHKTISFSDEFVPDGRVIAIEMLPENVKVLQKNIEANGLSDKITVAPYGVWDEDKSLTLYSKGWQKNSLVDIGRLDASKIEVPVRRIDTIMSECGVGEAPIDLVYVTVNGAEYQALCGLGDYWDQLKAAFVVSAYEVDGKSNNQLCRDILGQKGFKITDSRRPSPIIAKR